jgi:prepilin-type N-terminal cleavage/methylation domain-containing protein
MPKFLLFLKRSANRIFFRKYLISSRSGFTLVEIMIVVAIIIILASLVIPNMLRSRRTANESVAMQNLRALNSACQTYMVNKQTFPENLSLMIGPNSDPPYIDPEIASGTKQGYNYIYTFANQYHFTANANPIIEGTKYFYTDESGVIRFNPEEEAGPDDEITK